MLVSNRKALHDYFIVDSWETGIVLKGTEIKSLRNSQASIAESWIKIQNGEVWLIGATIPPYENAKAGWVSHEPTRTRKLLLRKKEILRIERELQPSMTLIPLDIHLNDRGLAKLKIGLAKGKRDFDKRESIKKRDNMRHGY